MTRNALMVAYHFPPFQRSSGIQRTLNFVRHMPTHGWSGTVLSAHPMAFRARGDEQLADIPAGVEVLRPLAFDAARHFAIAGRFPRALARPDAWGSWRFAAVPAAVRAVRRTGARVLWSTFPIATAHLIAARVRARTGLPWVADFRDLMTDDNYPPDPAQFADFSRIEAMAAREAAALVFTTPGAVERYRARYPDVPAERFHLVENGFDEAAFSGLTVSRAEGVPGVDRPLRLLHSGIVYPAERDPSALFDALAALRREGRLAPGQLRIDLRATANDAAFAPRLRELGLDDMVHLLPGLPYREALAEMQSVDGLLVLQGASCNQQIPAKVYEYLRAGRPILGLADPAGDTGQLLRGAGVEEVCALEDATGIAAALLAFVDGPARAAEPWQPAVDVSRYSRAHRAQELAALFDAVAD